MEYQNIEIRRPKMEETEKLNDFFYLVITDTYVKEGISEQSDDMKNEIESKKTFLMSDFYSNGENRYFLIAIMDGKMIGTIEYGPSSELIHHCTNGELDSLGEVGTVFVHPDYQGKGIGSKLLQKMLSALKNKGIEEFCLDSGYTIAQKIWKRKFGEPDYLVKDYWGAGYDHMIWKIRINQFRFSGNNNKK